MLLLRLLLNLLLMLMLIIGLSTLCSCRIFLVPWLLCTGSTQQHNTTHARAHTHTHHTQTHTHTLTYAHTHTLTHTLSHTHTHAHTLTHTTLTHTMHQKNKNKKRQFKTQTIQQESDYNRRMSRYLTCILCAVLHHHNLHLVSPPSYHHPRHIPTNRSTQIYG